MQKTNYLLNGVPPGLRLGGSHGSTARRQVPDRAVLFLLLAISVSLLSFDTPARAQADAFAAGDDSIDSVQVARLSLSQNGVSVQRGDDTEQTFEGAVNTPLQTGDRVYTGDNGRAELELGGNLVRLNSGSGLEVLELSSAVSQIRLPAGTATVNLRYRPDHPLEIDTPNAAITLLEVGEYRVNVSGDAQSEVIVFRGGAEVYNGDRSVPVGAGKEASISENDVALNGLPQGDDWDSWNQQRDYDLTRSDQSRQYVGDGVEVAGTEDLDANGHWADVPDYGRCWTPDAVASDWAPYRDGQWLWRDPFGWTWVSAEPWGWAPYHYGRWAVVSNRWYWVPGAGRRRYAPALVGFVTYNDGSIGWVPIAPRERFYGWWGGRGAVYAGPTVYVNQRFRNSVTLTTREGFVAGRVYHRELIGRPGFDYRAGRPVAVLQVVPTRASLVPHFGHVVLGRPAPAYFNRQVIVRNTRVPVVRPFSEKIIDIRSRGGAPVREFRTNNSGRIATREFESRGRVGILRPAGRPNASGNADARGTHKAVDNTHGSSYPGYPSSGKDTRHTTNASGATNGHNYSYPSGGSNRSTNGATNNTNSGAGHNSTYSGGYNNRSTTSTSNGVSGHDTSHSGDYNHHSTTSTSNGSYRPNPAYPGGRGTNNSTNSSNGNSGRSTTNSGGYGGGRYPNSSGSTGSSRTSNSQLTNNGHGTNSGGYGGRNASSTPSRGSGRSTTTSSGSGNHSSSSQNGKSGKKP